MHASKTDAVRFKIAEWQKLTYNYQEMHYLIAHFRKFLAEFVIFSFRIRLRPLRHWITDPMFPHTSVLFCVRTSYICLSPCTTWNGIFSTLFIVYTQPHSNINLLKSSHTCHDSLRHHLALRCSFSTHLDTFNS